MNGIFVINKPSGLTSSDVVVRCKGIMRKFTGEKIKCGHMGTLDPAAVGVLLVGVGKATKLFDYFLTKKKTYRAKFIFGKETNTLDSEGEITQISDLPSIDRINESLSKFIGDIMQMPPQYSAKNVNGQRAYDLARKGEISELSSKLIKIFDLKLISYENINGLIRSICVDIVCGSGTYIRSLCRDIAYDCGVVGYMSYLIRMDCGDYDINNASLMDDIQTNPYENLLEIKEVIKRLMPLFEIDEQYRFKISNGVSTFIENAPNENFGATFDGKIFGIAQNIDGKIKIITNLWN